MKSLPRRKLRWDFVYLTTLDYSRGVIGYSYRHTPRLIMTNNNGYEHWCYTSGMNIHRLSHSRRCI